MQAALILQRSTTSVSQSVKWKEQYLPVFQCQLFDSFVVFCKAGNKEIFVIALTDALVVIFTRKKK